MNVTCHACVGGVNIRDTIKSLETGVQVVAGTPGRIFDMVKRSALRKCLFSNYRTLSSFIFIGSENIKMLVLDEADEMLSRGFKDQIYDLFTMLPPNIQIILLSSTMPPDLLEFATKFMNNPVKILTKIEELTLEGIRQFYVAVEHEVYSSTLYFILMNLQIIAFI